MHATILCSFNLFSLPPLIVLKKFFLFSICFVFFFSATGSRAGGCLPLYSNSGSRRPDRQEGPAHQTTRPLRWSFNQGGFCQRPQGTDSSQRSAHQHVADRVHRSKSNPQVFNLSRWMSWHQIGGQRWQHFPDWCGGCYLFIREKNRNKKKGDD